MTDLRYLAPDTLDEAIGAFAAAGSAARILAGGTDLLVQMRAGSVKPGVIVDIKKIAEMTAIDETADGGFRIGAAVPGKCLAKWADRVRIVGMGDSYIEKQLVQRGGHLRVVAMIVLDASQKLTRLLDVPARYMQLQLGQIPGGSRAARGLSFLAGFIDQGHGLLGIALCAD